MKKLLMVLLVIVLMISFTACGGNDETETVPQIENETTHEEPATTPNPEEVEEEPVQEEDYTITELTHDMLEKASSNKDAATELNNGNYYTFTGIINKVKKDYAIVQFVNEYSAPYWNVEKFCAYVYLDSTSLADLTEWQTILVTGKVSNVLSTSTDDESGIVLSITDASVQTEFELEGELLGKDEFYSDADSSVWDMDIEGDVYPVLLNLSKEEIESLSECKTYIGREVILRTKIIKGWYTDAELVEVLS